MAAPTNNLPGTNVVLNDLGLRLAVPEEGPKVTLIGIATNPAFADRINEPQRVVNSERAIDALFFADTGTVFTGGSGNKWPSDLSLGVEEAFSAGAVNVEVVISALKTGDDIFSYPQVQKYLDLSGSYAALLGTQVDVVALPGHYFDEPELDSGATGFNFGKQLADFCYQATKNANSAVGVIAMQPVLRFESQLAYHGSGDFGGHYGVFSNYSGSYSGEHWRFDTPSLSSVNGWVNFLDLVSNQAYMTGSVPPLTGNVQSGQQWVNSKLQSYLQGSELAAGTLDTVNANYLVDWQALETDGTRAVDNKGNPVDAGGYLNVVAAPLRAFSTQARRLAAYRGRSIASNSYNTGGAAAYAGKIVSLVPHSGTTNKSVRDIGPSRDLGRILADKMVGRRFVTFVLNNRGYVVAKGVTGARNAGRYARSDYVLLSTMRVIHSIVDAVRTVAEKYIGEAATAQTRNAMEQDINSQIDAYKEQGAIQDGNAVLSATPEQQTLGETDVNVTIVPAIELTRVNLVVTQTQTLS